MTTLEPLDIKIIKELLADGRTSFVDLASVLGVSKDIITQHYSKLKKQGIITGATIQLNYKHLGYQAVATIFINVDSKNLDSVLANLVKIPSIYPRCELISRHNIRIVSTLKKIEDLTELKNRIRRQNTGINAMTTLIWTDVRNSPENLTLNNQNVTYVHSTLPVKINNNPISIDEIDSKIIKELEKDGRLPFNQIGKKLKIATDTVCRRYAKLKENGTVKVIIRIDPLKVGYNAMAEYYLSFQTFEGSQLVIDKLSRIADVSYVSKISGDYDLIVAALVRDFDHVAKIREQIFDNAFVACSEVKILKIFAAWPTPRQNISTF